MAYYIKDQKRATIGGYTLPQAGEQLGGVKADAAQPEDTQPVRIGTDGKLVTAPGSGGSGTLQEVLEAGNEAVNQSLKVRYFLDGMDISFDTNGGGAEVTQTYSDDKTVSAGISAESISAKSQGYDTNEEFILSLGSDGTYLQPFVTMTDGVKEAFKETLGTPSLQEVLEAGNTASEGIYFEEINQYRNTYTTVDKMGAQITQEAKQGGQIVTQLGASLLPGRLRLTADNAEGTDTEVFYLFIREDRSVELSMGDRVLAAFQQTLGVTELSDRIGDIETALTAILGV